jgi:hypothetical protein
MIIIDKAVLHIMDLNSGMTVYSDEELSIKDSIETFLLKHIEKSWNSQEAKPGEFYEDSSFKDKLNSYMMGETDFISFSKDVGRTFEEAFCHAEEMTSADLIMADIRIDDRRQIVIFKCDSHIGYIHQVNQTENGIKNEIINHYAIMPNLTQKMDEFAFIDAENMTVSVSSKRYTIDGNRIFVFPEIMLECSLDPSPKEAIKSLNKTVKKVAEAYGQNEASLSAAVKNCVAETMQSAIPISSIMRETRERLSGMDKEISTVTDNITAWIAVTAVTFFSIENNSSLSVFFIMTLFRLKCQ